ncbi:hypothetical protein [Mucilaginibacter sp. FT3.2]|uniref:hypothetical protein n=1 Tax=Mucilaginibacter sp. FT3.2 TaxID=2723090 RepID=UPI001616886D|nr:hypothetical protein [Mucilaginibacter sp. FT3.2]MBB6231419.1 hypothetical protein [Mucilaginibacter sp. FT3.2]
MKRILLNYKYCLALTICVLLLSNPSAGLSLSASAQRLVKPDSNLRVSKVRQVLISQQLFLVELSPVKGSKPKDKLVNFKGELRDAFMIICYNGNKTIEELGWSMCPNGKCPIGKSYNAGTKEYDELDGVIAAAKANNIKLQEKLKKLRKQSR